jgi:hypothetical protein
VSVERFMRQRAVNVTVDGSYTLQRWYDAQGKIRTLACRTTRVSPYRMIVQVPVVGRVGDRVTSYFDAFGAFEGSVSDTMDGSFLLELEMAHDQRARLSERLTWLEKRQKDPSILEQRDNARVIPKDPHTTLTLADGSVYRCFIIDMSPTGAAVSSELRPPLGMPLAIGSCVGRVVRLFATGFAIKFVETLYVKDLSRLIVRAEPMGVTAADDMPAIVSA